MMLTLFGGSVLQWTLVKPPRLVNGDSAGNYRVGAELKVGMLSAISRQLLAKFIVDEVIPPHQVNKAVFICAD